MLHEAQALPDLAVGEHDGGGRRQRAAGGNADQRRIGQRIAKQSLHDRARGGEQRADHRGRGDPRNPDRPQHELVARQGWTGIAPQPERGRQPRQWNAGGAHRQRDQRRSRERDEQADEGEGRGRPERVSAARLPLFGAAGKSGHSRQFALAAAGVNFSACGASAG